MADTKTDSSSTPLSDDPANPTKGLSAKPNTASHPAGAEPALDTLFHRTSRDSDLIRRRLTSLGLCVTLSLLKSLRRPTQGGQPCLSQGSTHTQRIP